MRAEGGRREKRGREAGEDDALSTPTFWGITDPFPSLILFLVFFVIVSHPLSFENRTFRLIFHKISLFGHVSYSGLGSGHI